MSPSRRSAWIVAAAAGALLAGLAVAPTMLGAAGEPTRGVEPTSSSVPRARAAARAEASAKLLPPAPPFEPAGPRQPAGDAIRSGILRTPVASFLAQEPPPAGTVTVRVVDLAGEPIGGAGIYVVASDEEDPEPVHRWSRPSGLPYRDPFHGLTDGTGVCTLRDLPADRYRVGAWTWEHAYAATATFDLGEDAPGIRRQLRLEAVPPERLVAGRVVGEDGGPPGRITIRWLRAEGDGLKTAYPHRRSDGSFYVALEDTSRPGTLRASAGGSPRYGLRSDPPEPLRYAVLEGVQPGTTDLELRLREPRTVLLDVKDAGGGRLAQPWTASFEVETEGVWLHPRAVQVLAESFDVTPSDPCARLPWERFRVSVSAYGMHRLELGPYREADLADVLPVRLEAMPVVAGRVLAGGELLYGARVDLQDVSLQRPVGVSTQTDELAWFSIPVALAGTFAVRVRSDRGWDQASPPFELDGERSVTGLIVDVGVSGRVSGTLRVPAGENPADWFVLFRDEEDSSRCVPRQVTGARSFDSGPLRPGAWSVFRFRGNWTTWTRFSAGVNLGEETSLELPGFRKWAIDATPLLVRVEPGRELHLELDAEAPPPVRLHGRLTVTDLQPVAAEERERVYALCGTGYVAQPDARLLELDDDRAVSGARVHEDGSFELGAREPGTYRFAADHEDALGGTLHVEDTLQLGEGETEWKLALELGTLRVRFAGEAEELPYSEVEYGTTAPNGAVLRSSLLEREADGRRYFVGRLPAGSGVLRLRESATKTWRERAVHVVPGQDVELLLP